MQIEDSRKDEKNFEDLRIGDTFYAGDTLCMKLTSSTGIGNALNLRCDCLCSVGPRDIVNKVLCKIVVIE